MIGKQPQVETKTEAITICRRCRSEIGRGKRHVCSEAQAVKNLTNEAVNLGSAFGNAESRAYERVATNLIKVAEKENEVPRGEKMSLATGITHTMK